MVQTTGGGFDLSYALSETPPTIDVSTLACVQRPACGYSINFDASVMKHTNKMLNDQAVGMDQIDLSSSQTDTCNPIKEDPTTAGIDSVSKQEDAQS